MSRPSYGKHATIPQGTAAAVRWLECQPGVNRLIFGRYRLGSMRSIGELSVVGPCRGGLCLLAKGQSVGILLYAHTDDPDALAERVRVRYARAS